MPRLLEIKYYGNMILEKKTERVKELTPELKLFIDDLIFTMYHNKGIGLAAPQVGLSKSIFVVDTQYLEKGNMTPIVLINPEIVMFEDERIFEEGCLSIPDIFLKMNRFNKIKVTYLDDTFLEQKLIASELLAHVIQHEYDHLNGKLFIDSLSYMRRLGFSFKLNKIMTIAKEMKSELVYLNENH
jgi:peptide deformylase